MLKQPSHIVYGEVENNHKIRVKMEKRKMKRAAFKIQNWLKVVVAKRKYKIKREKKLKTVIKLQSWWRMKYYKGVVIRNLAVKF